MQQRPDVPATLDAIMRFLLQDLHPTVTDKGLQFRVLVAANALNQCAAELRAEPARSTNELARLRALIPDFAGDPRTEPATDEARLALVRALDRELAERLRDGRLSPTVEGPVLEHLVASLRATLQATNPRFDLADTID
ncbi:MAG: hypothetical protein JNK05_25535 [Myxococcales bacterium]|nr:hypothetical protein [Myxococcales bacterium]